MESARCKAFLEAAERGSFKAAAEAMGYTPSAISQLIAALENDLGLNLLIRSKKGVKPTAEGAKLIPIVRSYLAREKEMYELASEMQGLSVGNLTIAAYPSVATTWLPGIVRNFQKDFPSIEFNIMEGVRQEIFHHLDQHEADLEEVYCYFDMPKPHFGFHISYLKSADVEEVMAHPVHTGTCVQAPCGYHPTVASPGTQNTYLWVLAGFSHEQRRYDLAVLDPARDGLAVNTPAFRTVKAE